MDKPRKLEIQNVYLEDALAIQSAKRTGGLIHKTGDIDASGDDVEVSFRHFLGKRLPAKYHVGHGHIVDKHLTVSPQLDVIISDSSACPVLFEGKNGTEYYPYESVYAYGELRSSYNAGKKPVETFAKTCETIDKTLQRDKTPTNYIGGGVTLGPGLGLSGLAHDFRNPMFTFMLFVESGDLARKKILSEYAKAPEAHLPNVVCFLDGSVINKLKLRRQLNEFEVEYSVTNSHLIRSDKDLWWGRLLFPDKALGPAQALAHLMTGLSDHLNSCLLLPPPVHEYMKPISQKAAFHGELLDLSKMLEGTRPDWRDHIDELLNHPDLK